MRQFLIAVVVLILAGAGQAASAPSLRSRPHLGCAGGTFAALARAPRWRSCGAHFALRSAPERYRWCTTPSFAAAPHQMTAPAASSTPAEMTSDACRPVMNMLDWPTSDPNNATPSTLPVWRVALEYAGSDPGARFLDAAEQG